MKSRILTTLLVSAAFFVQRAVAAEPAENWDQHCSGCHGSDGKGETRIGRKAGAKNLTLKPEMAKITDADIFKLVKEGRVSAKGEEKMESFSDRMNDADIKALIVFVREFSK